MLVQNECSHSNQLVFFRFLSYSEQVEINGQDLLEHRLGLFVKGEQVLNRHLSCLVGEY